MPVKKSGDKNPQPRQAKRGGQKSKTIVKRAPVKKVVEKKEVSRSAGPRTDVYDISGKIISKIELPKEIFGAKINNQLMAQAVRVYLANQRRGTVSTKTRGEVRGSTKKIWRQKGTGRARHGSKNAPIFVGGGVVFGPKPRDHSLKLSKKMKKAALFSALSEKLSSENIKVVSGLEQVEPKTKKMNEILTKLGFDEGKRNILLIVPGTSKNGLANIYRSSRNLKGIDVISANLINTYEVLRAKSLLLMKDSIGKIKENFLKEKK